MIGLEKRMLMVFFSILLDLESVKCKTFQLIQRVPYLIKLTFFVQIRKAERLIMGAIIFFLIIFGGAETETVILYIYGVIAPLLMMVTILLFLIIMDHHYSGQRIKKILKEIFAYNGKGLE